MVARRSRQMGLHPQSQERAAEAAYPRTLVSLSPLTRVAYLLSAGAGKDELPALDSHRMGTYNETSETVRALAAGRRSLGMDRQVRTT